jgi:hypothetical protein
MYAIGINRECDINAIVDYYPGASLPRDSDCAPGLHEEFRWAQALLSQLNK